MNDDWRYRVVSRYAGAPNTYADNRYRLLSQAAAALSREKREAEALGYAVRIVVYFDDDPVASAETRGR